jgi:hypothetical protein
MTHHQPRRSLPSFASHEHIIILLVKKAHANGPGLPGSTTVADFSFCSLTLWAQSIQLQLPFHTVLIDSKAAQHVALDSTTPSWASAGRSRYLKNNISRYDGVETDRSLCSPRRVSS